MLPRREENFDQSKTGSVNIFLQCNNKEYVNLLSTISYMVNVWLFFQVRKEARSRHIVQINI